MRNMLMIVFALACIGSWTSAEGQTAQTTCPTMPATMDHANMDPAVHAAMISGCSNAQLPTQAGQAAYGTIAEIVRMLEADSSTDWTRVNVEALRQHLIDMDEVTLRSAVAQRAIEGGFEADVTGSGRTVAAIRRMLSPHVAMLNRGGVYQASSQDVDNGARITITARDRSDKARITRIRGLGFAGMLTEGNHHAAHHLALARGDIDAHSH